MKQTLFFFIFLFSFYSNAKAQVTYYISPSGNDKNSGTIDLPFASIERAREIVRKVNKDMKGDIIVFLRQGRHELTSTFKLSNIDKGTNGYNIIYKAYLSEIPVISGGIVITGWTLHDPNKNIYKAFVGTSVDTRQLYVNGRRAIRARSKDGTDWIESGDGYTCPPEVAIWNNIANVEIVSRKEWKCHRGPVAAVNGKHVVMAQPFWNNLHKQYDAPVAWVENAYELLDAEDEWYLNRSTGILYYKPRAGENIIRSEVILPKLETLVSGTATSNIHFKGIVFSHATWLHTNSVNGFPCVQGGYLNSGDQIPGNLIFDHCANLSFEKNTFEHLGVDAIQLYMGCKNNLIRDNVFRDVSGSAISIGPVSYSDSISIPSLHDLVVNNTVDNNLITNVAVEYEGCPGIFVGYTEHTSIIHNELRHLPYSGISIGWGWKNTITAGKNNEIGYNYIDSIMTTLKDGAGIYTLSSQPGTQVHDNYINNVLNYFSSLYPDEGSSNMRWHHNVVSNTFKNWLYMWKVDILNDTVDYNYYDNPTQITNGTNCVVRNNVYVQNGNWPAEAISIMNNSGRKGITKSPYGVVVEQDACGSGNYILKIACATKDANIRYTLDGTEPKISSQLYNGPIEKNFSTVIKVKAFMQGLSESETVVFKNPAAPKNPLVIAKLEQGLNFNYYEGKWTEVPDYKKLNPVESGIESNFILKGVNDKDNFGYSFNGYINIEKDGSYTFYINSDDGSRLFIDEELLVNNDGLHGANEKRNMVWLKKGIHAIQVDYFDDKGSSLLEVSYSGCQVSKRPIPSNMLFHKVR